MSALRHRFLSFLLVVLLGAGVGPGVTPAVAGQGPTAGPAAGKATAAATSRVASPATGKARVAKGVIVTHANSKLGDAKLAKMRPHYDELKPRIRTNTE